MKEAGAGGVTRAHRALPRWWPWAGLAAVVAAAGSWVVSGGSGPVPTRDAPAAAPPSRSDTAGELRGLERQAAMNPNDPDLAISLGQTYARLNLAGPALREFQRASRLEPDLIPARVGQGQMWLRLHRPRHAVEAYEWAAARLPDNADLQLELTAACLDLRDLTAAARHVHRALEMVPRSAVAHRAFSTVHLAMSRFEEAIAEARRATDLGPDDVQNWKNLGSTCLTARHSADAVQFLRRAVQVQPDDATSNVLLARALADQPPTPTSAREIYSLLARALSVDPYNADAAFQVGQYYLQQQDLERAVRMLRRARELDPRSPRTLLALGQALVRHGDVEEGRELVARSGELQSASADFTGHEYQAEYNPSPSLNLRLANLYLDHGYVDSAVHLLRKAIRQSPTDGALRSKLAEAEQREARLDAEILAAK